jgi:predicted dithiol-disulfide oxidoreductase (DUF899 family)
MTNEDREEALTTHRVVSRREWDAARAELLEREKEHTRMADDLARERRELPWVAIEKEYVLDGDDGPQTLAQLFGGRSQLLIYHFMFGPTYQAGCPTCSSMADSLHGLVPHLHARDLTVALVSTAPLERLQAFKQRMGWSIPWLSSANTDFSRDMAASFPVEQMRENMPPVDQLPPVAPQNAAATGTDVAEYISEMPTANVFKVEDGAVYQTYATTARGVEFLMGYYPILDRIADGRNEEGGTFQTWLRRHDEY